MIADKWVNSRNSLGNRFLSGLGLALAILATARAAEEPKSHGDASARETREHSRSFRWSAKNDRLTGAYDYFSGIGALAKYDRWTKTLPLAKVQADVISKLDDLVWDARENSWVLDADYLDTNPPDYKQYVPRSNDRRQQAYYHAQTMVMLGLLTESQSAFVSQRKFAKPQTRLSALLFDPYIHERLGLKLTEEQRDRLIRHGYDAAAAEILTDEQWKIWSELIAKRDPPAQAPELPALGDSEATDVELHELSPIFRKLAAVQDSLKLSAEQKRLLQDFKQVTRQGLLWVNLREPSDIRAQTRERFLRHAEQFVLLGILTPQQASAFIMLC